MSALLAARQLVKRFPGVVALDGVSFEVSAGEIHALCGENGAGKSTLIKTLAGVHPYGTYEGEILLDGATARFLGPADAREQRIAVIHQELALVEELSIAENIYLGDEPRRGGLVDFAAMRAGTLRALGALGVELDPDLPVRALGVAQRQIVEIAKATHRRSRVLILDEPTAALSAREVQRLMQLLRELVAQGLGCVYISHKLDEVFAVADRITVLRDGRSVATLRAAETSPSEVIRHMVGREVTELYPQRAAHLGEVALAVERLTVADGPRHPPRLRDVSFEVRAGEVLGIGGLMGAGRTELLMHLAGAWGTRRSGAVRVRGSTYSPATPADAIAAGVVLVSEDRKRYGLVLEQGVGFNVTLSSLIRFTRRGLVEAAREAAAAERAARELRVKAASLATPVGVLSGGNQQKVVLAKALLTEPRVVLLDEPTRGIDVGAKLEIYELMGRLTAAGLAVVLVSSELPELLGMSDRILMLREGEIGGVLSRAEATQERLMQLAMPQRRAAPEVA